MIVDAEGVADGATLVGDVVVVGAGPAGIVLALELATWGHDVVLLESGRTSFDADTQRLADAAAWDPDLHAPMSMTTRRQVGGASSIWGGRCVPFDPVDFDDRPYITDARWPVTYDELSPYFERTCTWLLCGRPVFDARQIARLPRTLVPGLEDDEHVQATELERWSLPTSFGAVYRRQLQRAANVRLVVGATCTGIVRAPDGRAADHIECATLGGTRFRVRGRQYVLSCGGLETTRLLLASRRSEAPRRPPHPHLGSWYMGHVEGVIANVRLTTPPEQTVYGYERDEEGVYVRRRLTFTRATQRRLELPNIAGWFANPELADARHGSGSLSFAYLALLSPLGGLFAPDAQRMSLLGSDIPGTPYGHAERRPVREHLSNVLRDLGPTLDFVVGFGSRRFLKRGRRAPGFFTYSAENSYPLQYHGEHRPHRASCVVLSDERDDVGVPRLDIRLRFSDDDVKGVLRAHEEWDRHLRSLGVGRLEYLHEDREAAVRARLGAGFHQSGTTRMSADARDGVVDAQLRLHDCDNVYVASSSAFVTSSQANSMFMIIAFSLRLADRLRAVLASPGC